MERVALYARVSTEEQKRRGLSLPEQEHVLEEYAKANKMKVVGKYLDGGVSGRKKYTKRPDLMRLLEDVKSDAIDTILFIKLDRWFRDIAGYYEVQKILDEHHTAWRATQEDYETVTASGRFKVNIMLSVAQDEADRTSERIKFVFDGKRERGEYTGGSVPLGYKLVNKKPVIDPDTAPLVRRIFDTYLETGSIDKTIRCVPEINMNYAWLRYLLYNPAYTGDFANIKIEPIITKEEHEKVLALKKHVVRKTKENRIYIFSGLLYCPGCGKRLGGKWCSANNRWGGEVKYYKCHVANLSTAKCTNNICYREDSIERYLLEHIDGKINTLLNTKPVQPKSSKPQRDALKRKLSKLSDLYINELISMEDYKQRYDALNAELAAIPEDAPPPDYSHLKETFVEDWKQLYNGLPDEGKQLFWRKTIKAVYFNGREVSDFIFAER